MMGLPPDRMRSDFGGEFLGEFMNGFLQVCAERGIHPEKSLPGESQQNGVAESSACIRKGLLVDVMRLEEWRRQSVCVL